MVYADAAWRHVHAKKMIKTCKTAIMSMNGMYQTDVDAFNVRSIRYNRRRFPYVSMNSKQPTTTVHATRTW